MNYGMYISASGALTAMHRLDIAANNLANIETVAYKADVARDIPRDVARIEDRLPYLPSNELLEKLGGGVLSSRTGTKFAPGSVRSTGNPLDIAIRNEGFFVTQQQHGRGGEPELYFTRDGKLSLDSRGRLVQATTGRAMLDDRDNEIFVKPGALIHIDGQGRVVENGVPLAKIQITGVRSTEALEKIGDGLYRARVAGQDLRVELDVDIRTESLENSGVDAVQAMMAVTKAQGAANRSIQMIDIHNRMMQATINTFARVG